MSGDIEVALAVAAELGEGPVWSARAQVLYWVDIPAPAVHRFDPASGRDTSFRLPQNVGAICRRAGGGFLAAMVDRIVAVSDDGVVAETVARPPPHPEVMRFNDGKCDAAGRFWIGTMTRRDGCYGAALYRLDPDRTFRTMVRGVGTSNGLGWSPDGGTMYATDSRRMSVFRYDFDLATGTLANRRPFVRLGPGEGRPDGLAVDREGGVWMATWDGASVRRYDPDGRLDRLIAMPVRKPTSVAFGGPDLATLYVTSARAGLSTAELASAPLSGNVFALKPGVAGLPVADFAG